MRPEKLFVQCIIIVLSIPYMHTIMVDLKKLRHAVIVAQERNFSRAARKLHISQPALSRSISNLEEGLGLRLFDRNPADIAVTTIGREFIERASHLLQHAQAFSYDMSLLRGGLTGNAAFGMGPYPAAAFMQELLTTILMKKHGLHVRVEVTNVKNLLEHLATEQIEFFVADTRQISLGPKFYSQRLTKLGGSMFVREGHPAISKISGNSKNLSQYPIVGAPMPQSNLDDIKKRIGLSSTSEFQMTVICEDIHYLKFLAIKTDAILIAPYAAVATECDAEILTELKPSRIVKKGYGYLDIVMLANRSRSPAATLIIETLERIAKKNP